MRFFTALIEANGGSYLPYGNDAYSRAIEKQFSEVFETEVGVCLVATGTGANALALASTTPPYGAIFCRRGSHIEANEGGAVEHLAGGARLVPLEGAAGKLTASELDAAIAAYSPQARFFRPSTVSLTQSTELGTVYSVAEVKALSEITHRHGLRLHVDGARWANAVAAARCSPAEMSWKAGVDVLSFGATKNGAIAAEAVVFFDRSLMHGVEERRKRAGMLWSKHRFLAVQWQAYLADGLWLRLAGAANARATALEARLTQIGCAQLTQPVEANEVFVRLPDAVLDRLEGAGFQFYRRGGGLIRLVTSFATSEADVEKFAEAVARFGADEGMVIVD